MSDTALTAKIWAGTLCARSSKIHNDSAKPSIQTQNLYSDNLAKNAMVILAPNTSTHRKITASRVFEAAEAGQFSELAHFRAGTN